MDSRFWWSFLLALAMASAGARSQSTDALGFLSIDCGIESGSSYVDPTTGISYVSDAGFITTGVNRNISDAYVGGVSSPQLHTLRSFPDGTQNCYAFGLSPGSKYLLRAWFLYGDYDGLNGQPLAFDLRFGVNYWARVNITDAESIYWTEVITVATGDSSVCLVNTGTGAPFISGIDIRPLRDSLYPAANEGQTLILFNRWNFGEASETLRYPADPIDRVWTPWSSSQSNWNDVSTDSTVQNNPQDLFEVPSVVMQTAATPIDSSSLVFRWDPFLVFRSRIRSSTYEDFTYPASSRHNSAHIMNPPYLNSVAVYSLEPLVSSPTYNLSLDALSNSTIPPILNAFELYTAMNNTSVPSDAGDVDVMTTIKEWYQIQGNWMGDPCSPNAFVWDGLNCTYNLSNSPRVTALNLSSCSLSGPLPRGLDRLPELAALSLSDNNLSGPITPGLSLLPALRFLDLSRNAFSGRVPQDLVLLPSLLSLDLSSKRGGGVDRGAGRGQAGGVFARALRDFEDQREVKETIPAWRAVWRAADPARQISQLRPSVVFPPDLAGIDFDGKIIHGRMKVPFLPTNFDRINGRWLTLDPLPSRDRQVVGAGSSSLARSTDGRRSSPFAQSAGDYAPLSSHTISIRRRSALLSSDWQATVLDPPPGVGDLRCREENTGDAREEEGRLDAAGKTLDLVSARTRGKGWCVRVAMGRGGGGFVIPIPAPELHPRPHPRPHPRFC
ncbi:putative LRR receptor-like serine/threonine-protein kinase At1g05700 [Curcuma longa]|uniref:putative LRR receptor-like serine/threonine-protein kinase At1g05700 n=1 Tax=Curcuma longa TaxID=136217 RepID=UPI003D9F6933